MKIAFDIIYKPAAEQLRDITPKMVPYALATMLTKLGMDGRDHVRERLPQLFDRPTDFTVRGVYTKSATKAEPVSLVYVPDSQDDQGRGRREYIRPGAQGAAQRRQKRTEYLLSKMGVLPPGWVTVPGRRMQLDQYGNLPGRIYAQIINVLQLKAYKGGRPVAERSRKRAVKLGVDSEFFAIPPGPNHLSKTGGWLPPGVWKHLPGRDIVQVLKFVKKASYRPRMSLKNEVQASINTKLQLRFDESFAAIVERFNRRK